jgi:hypothetical protein
MRAALALRGKVSLSGDTTVDTFSIDEFGSVLGNG